MHLQLIAITYCSFKIVKLYIDSYISKVGYHVNISYNDYVLVA